MKTSEVDILILPGLTGGTPQHWYARWNDRLETARRVDPADPHAPDRAEWTKKLVDAVAAARRPVVLVAHSLGTAVAVHATKETGLPGVAGAFLVAVPDVERTENMPAEVAGFAPLPRNPLPFPSMVVASRTDVWCDYERVEDFAASWGSLLIDAGDAGHLNDESGHGPWPEGLTRFAMLMKRIG
ncbi:RBBP9/YdeN family alpha/beta hydrolase [Amorphus sp. 3PC139-8]|uniref:RBBP9/YdeN family alpha/beta hydrolase n=1 Tax=Amorphus sp. 3PC139-8 TaxID=2735676 RepID=UPI00345D2571